MTHNNAVSPLNFTRLTAGRTLPSPEELRYLAATLLQLADAQEAPQPEDNPIEVNEGLYLVSADGSALGNPGPGGWAYLIRGPRESFETNSGGIEYATNNIAELQAATEALNALPTDAVGIIRSDSNYVVKGVNEWRRGWEKRGWKKGDGSPVLNVLEWKALLRAVDAHPGMKLQWVRGHYGDPDNEAVDLLARTAAIDVQQRQYTAGR